MRKEQFVLFHFALTKLVSADGQWNRTGVQPFCLSFSWFSKKLLWPLLYAVPATQMQHRWNGFLHTAHSPVLQSFFWRSILDPREGRITMKKIQPSWILGRIATRLHLAVMSCVHSCGGRVLPFPLSHLTTIAAAREKKKLQFLQVQANYPKPTRLTLNLLCSASCEKEELGQFLKLYVECNASFSSNSHKQSVQRLLHNKSGWLRGTGPKSTCWCNILWIPIETTNYNSWTWFFFSFFDLTLAPSDPPPPSHIPLFFPPKLSLPGWNTPATR